MSIARAFTTRRVKQSLIAAETAEGLPHRSNTTSRGYVGSRPQISGPLELIHTTNMLAYNAPDLYPKTASSTNSSHKSDDDLSDAATTAASTPPTSPDVDSPKRVLSPEPNHLSCYFTVPSQTSTPPTPVEAPVIPHRAPSHTKKSYDGLGRQRSNSRLSEQSQRTVSTKASFSFSRSSSTSTNTTASSQNPSPPQHRTKASGSHIVSPPQSLLLHSAPPAPQLQHSHRNEISQSQHPFGQELAKVSEIAEEFGVKEAVNEGNSEEKELATKGLLKFSADDYMSEIQGLLSSFFGDVKPMANTMWI